MTVKKYDKLVRDRIPAIIKEQGKQCSYYVADDNEYQNRLIYKLKEELQEFEENPCVEELADLHEVVVTIAETNKWDLLGARIKKNLKRGAFQKKYVLREVSE